MILEGIYRRFLPLKDGKGQIDVRMTHCESLATAQVEPLGYEITRSGRMFSLVYTGAVPTGIAPVQAFPTTAAQWVIWNGDTNKAMTFKSLGALLFSGTKGLGGTLLACIFQAPAQTALAHVAGLSTASQSNGSLTSKAVVKSGITLTGPAVPLWFPVAEDRMAAAVIGPANALINRALDGSVIVPPLQGLGLAVLAPAGTTPLYLPVASWVELESDLE